MTKYAVIQGWVRAVMLGLVTLQSSMAQTFFLLRSQLILSAFSQVFPPFFLLTVYSTKPLSHWYRIMNQPKPTCNNRAVLFFYSCTFYIQKEVPLFYCYAEECRQSHWMLVLPISPAHLPWDRWLQSVGSWWGQRRWGRLVSHNLQGRWSWAPRDWWPPVTRNTQE